MRDRAKRLRRLLRLALAGWLLSFLAAHAAQDVSVTTKSNGRTVRISAQATLQVPHALIWETLTDYAHLSDFIPGMKRSRLMERRGDTAVVEQIGSAHFLAFTHAIKVVVESIEHHPSAIGIRIVRGNLKQLDGQYEIESLGERGYVLRWVGIIEPELPLPGFVSAPLLRTNIADQFLGMVHEIERRHALRNATAATF